MSSSIYFKASTFTACRAIVLLCLIAPALLGQASSTESAETDNSKKTEKAQKAKPVDVELARGRVKLQVPDTWKTKAVRSRILEREFVIPKQTGDAQDGRLTMMRSGGSIQANVTRWMGQFTQPDGSDTKDAAKVTEMKVNGQDAVVVNISGTFSESMGGGPFAPGKTVKRENYQMLGGIVQTKAAGQYFFKLYGPKKTIAAAEKDFKKMIESVTSE